VKAQAAPGLLLAISVALLASRSASSQDELQRVYSEAQQAQAAGDLATATAKYEEIVRLQPRMAEAYANLGNLYYQQTKMSRAKTAYTKAAALKPNLGGPQFFLGVIAFGEHDYASALHYLQRAQTLQPGNSLILAYLGYTAYARNAFHDAAQALEEALALDKNDIDVLYHLSKCYGHLADESLTRLKNKYGDSVWTNLARAHAFETQENWKAAGEHYSLASQQMPDSASLQQKVLFVASKASGGTSAVPSATDPLIEGSLSYKDVHLSGPRLDDAIAHWQTTVRGQEKETSDGKQTYQVAEGYQVLSYLLTLRVVESDPNSYRVHQLQAQSLEASDKDEAAIAEYRKALEKKPDLQNIHFAIGSLYWKAQSFDAARKELDKELKLNPNHPQALYELGDIAAFAGDAVDAEKDFLAALKLDASLVEAHLALEKLYTQSGRFALSVEHLKKVLAIVPTEARVHYRLAVVYRKQGQTAAADRELALFNQQPASSKAQ